MFQNCLYFCEAGSAPRKYAYIFENGYQTNTPISLCCIPPNFCCPGMDNIYTSYFDRGIWDTQDICRTIGFNKGDPKLADHVVRSNFSLRLYFVSLLNAILYLTFLFRQNMCAVASIALTVTTICHRLVTVLCSAERLSQSFLLKLFAFASLTKPIGALIAAVCAVLRMVSLVIRPLTS